MQKIVVVFMALFLPVAFFVGCTVEEKSINILEGKVLLKSKCAQCHNLAIPPETFPDEVAPPMMAVTFHIYDFIEVSTPDDKLPASVSFVKDYVLNPSRDKSFCDQKSLDVYGLMPSQRGRVSEEELEAIAIYMFDHYNQENFLRVMKERQALKAMAPGERLAQKLGCLRCHGLVQKKMGPSFTAVAQRYRSNSDQIKASIKFGSQDQWEEARHAKMPAFKQLADQELDTLSKWILKEKQ